MTKKQTGSLDVVPLDPVMRANIEAIEDIKHKVMAGELTDFIIVARGQEVQPVFLINASNNAIELIGVTQMALTVVTNLAVSSSTEFD